MQALVAAAGPGRTGMIGRQLTRLICRADEQDGRELFKVQVLHSDDWTPPAFEGEEDAA